MPPRTTANAEGDEGEVRYQIGEVAERTGVTQRTLRFYEERGLLQPADRMDGGFRLYSDRDVERINLIRQLQSLLNLSLGDIKEMVDAEELRAQIRATFSPDRDLPARLERTEKVTETLQRQLEIVDSRLEALRGMKDKLAERLAAVEKRRVEITAAMDTGKPLSD